MIVIFLSILAYEKIIDGLSFLNSVMLKLSAVSAVMIIKVTEASA